MILKVPSNPNYSIIQFYFIILLDWVWRRRPSAFLITSACWLSSLNLVDWIAAADDGVSDVGTGSTGLQALRFDKGKEVCGWPDWRSWADGNKRFIRVFWSLTWLSMEGCACSDLRQSQRDKAKLPSLHMSVFAFSPFQSTALPTMSDILRMTIFI